MEMKMCASRRLLKIADKSRRNRIGRYWVKVWPQLVRRNAVAQKICNRNHGLSRRHFELDAIKPAPDMHLTDLAVGDAIPNATRQMRLATGHFDRFKK
ncbi:MAG: hypothetical protein H6R18_1921 [Proteobacteria bacterium]|nr:hypothetical protein [Pseudomonadota bacterium]